MMGGWVAGGIRRLFPGEQQPAGTKQRQHLFDICTRNSEATLASAYPSLRLGHASIDIAGGVNDDAPAVCQIVAGIESDQSARPSMLARIGITGDETAAA